MGERKKASTRRHSPVRVRASKGCRGIIIAGTASGVGKTSLTLGLVRALVRRGLRVQPFKAGPDFLDPTYLSRAAGRTCYNLDGWMTGRAYVSGLFARASADADLAVVEGVMGLFDGSEPTSLSGSTAELAKWLGLPVLLVADSHGCARSFAATVKGFSKFERGVAVAGVIANRSGSDRHREWLEQALCAAALPPLVGAVPLGALPELRSRHLGLVTADRDSLPLDVVEKLADACERHVEVDAVLELALPARCIGAGKAPRPVEPLVRIGVARDSAFHFYYADNLEALVRCGAELVSFSPLSDTALPGNLQGLYLGGGYPEERAAELASNRGMLESVRAFADSGRPLYAECGGLMYLADELADREGRSHRMAGVFPATVRMLPRLRSLGYVEVSLGCDSIWGGRGASFRGHEFHYSEVAAAPPAGSGWRNVYRGGRRSGPATEGFQKGHVLASYAHLHFASRPGAAEHFVERCKG